MRTQSLGQEDPLEEIWKPTPVFLLEKPHGQRSLTGYGPWGCIICGFYLFIFFLPVMLPSKIPKITTDLPVRGFPGVWKLLLFHNSLPGTSLHP